MSIVNYILLTSHISPGLHIWKKSIQTLIVLFCAFVFFSLQTLNLSITLCISSFVSSQTDHVLVIVSDTGANHFANLSTRSLRLFSWRRLFSQLSRNPKVFRLNGLKRISKILLLKNISFNFYLLLLQLVLCRVATLKSLPVHHP